MKSATSSPSTPRSYTPIPGPSRPHHLSRPDGIRPLVYLHHGESLIQQPNLLRIPGQVGFAGDRPLDTNTSPAPPAENADPFSENMLEDDLTYVLPSTVDAVHTRYRKKRFNQSNRWMMEVIPSLIIPYMHYLSMSLSLRLDVTPVVSCICEGPRRVFGIIVVKFSVLESTRINTCECAPAALQLIKMGLFPCSPIAPTLAVDVRVLDFVTRLFVHIPPNNTAWCRTVEEFLDSQGYKLTTQGSLRRRFSNALQWYNMLQDATTKHVDMELTQVRRVVTGDRHGSLVDGSANVEHSTAPPTLSTSPDEVPKVRIPNIPSRHRVTVEALDTEDEEIREPHSPSKRRRAAEEEEPFSMSSQPFPVPVARGRPSDYLRTRCPLCFGGEYPRRENSGPDAIVCVDACFTQKRNKQARDPVRTHPRTVFVPESDTIHMARYVESVRPTRSKPRKQSRRQDDEQDDKYEGPLRVPKSVLDGCEAGFTAADDARTKASTQFFDDTALMALLCRHDRVLWIVNMRSAGEKQHYTLVLIETLFQHLPLSFQIGLLYDIGCQLHRSCIKWGFLDRYLHRLTFAISVFHAFGHQWACQIIYHPRKCKGFGLSDGEGCERFWHSISKLISYLRVCGYHQRIYTLDRQVQQADREGLVKLVTWLLRRTRHCQEKRRTAEEVLHACGKSEELLRNEWNSQVEAQTKPLPRRSKNQGKNAVDEAIRQRKARDILKQRVTDSENIILDPDVDFVDIGRAEMQIADLRTQLEHAEAAIRSKERALGVDERAELRRLAGNPFIAARMNARALKMRLREKLGARKFEMDRVERSFRKQVNEQKVHSHTEASVRRRDPSIQQLARDYNKLCDVMQSLIDSRKAPHGAICPPHIETKGLFALDVDDEIWQDLYPTLQLDKITILGTPWA
ncbi:hypothetical protein D9615_008922 [Tricholomella constricta]|uniref:CxC1-like cysteine cluster associated with KDZ transposases domain-containing protein n=1 Tax=Tricholomella constricta TaxID=117010 RepID=A0A8H5LYY5_9AGAR|nr:hypothetical protein D9615_008922 [Tricholomella constricta]